MALDEATHPFDFDTHFFFTDADNAIIDAELIRQEQSIATNQDIIIKKKPINRTQKAQWII